TESDGALSVNVAVVATTEMVMSVPPGAFKPPPKVDSTVVRITPRETPLVAPGTLPGFRTFVQSAFSLRRKQMQKVLRTIRAISPEQAGAILERAEIAATARPEVVSPQAFARLYGML
ncbi:MAG: rRNA adenine N-6-methyltransferase family protein, partial [Thermoanaerobaculia bacterium]